MFAPGPGFFSWPKLGIVSKPSRVPPASRAVAARDVRGGMVPSPVVAAKDGDVPGAIRAGSRRVTAKNLADPWARRSDIHEEGRFVDRPRWRTLAPGATKFPAEARN